MSAPSTATTTDSGGGTDYASASSKSSLRDPTLDSPRSSNAAPPASASSASSSSSAQPASAASSSSSPPSVATFSSTPHPSKFELKSLTIPYGLERDGTVHYIVNVVTTTDEKWSCMKRFSAFERLHQVLVELFGHRGFPVGADLPPKRFKFFVSHVTQHFIEERRCLLDSYLNKMIKVQEVTRSDVWLDFLTSDTMPQYQDPPIEKSDVLDDCEITSVVIPQTRLMSDHVLYQVDVHNAKKRKSFSRWTVLKRFGQFFELDALLRGDFAENEELLAALPASPQRQSKLFYDHMDLNFVEHRRVLLTNYMTKLLQIKAVAQNAHFLAFLGVQT